MNGYADFKKKIGLKGQEVENLTGYTKAGLYNAFNMIDEGEQPSRRFLVCINSAIDKKIEEETKLYEEKLNSLRNLKNRFKGDI